MRFSGVDVVSRVSAFARPIAKAVLFDRDGTLVEDAPVGGEPDRVTLMPYAAESLARLAEAGIGVGVVTNQPGLANGAFTRSQHETVCARIEELAGAIGTWAVCDHGEREGCRCRKPAPGLILHAARALGVRPGDCVVVGDIGSDMGAARAAGARSILVPTPLTRSEEVARERYVAPDLERAVDLVLGGFV